MLAANGQDEPGSGRQRPRDHRHAHDVGGADQGYEQDEVDVVAAPVRHGSRT